MNYLDDLPRELLETISFYLDTSDLKTINEMYHIADNQYFWERYFEFKNFFFKSRKSIFDYYSKLCNRLEHIYNFDRINDPIDNRIGMSVSLKTLIRYNIIPNPGLNNKLMKKQLYMSNLKHNDGVNSFDINIDISRDPFNEEFEKILDVKLDDKTYNKFLHLDKYCFLKHVFD